MCLLQCDFIFMLIKIQMFGWLNIDPNKVCAQADKGNYVPRAWEGQREECCMKSTMEHAMPT